MFRVQMRKRAYKRLQDLAPTHRDTVAELIDILKTDPVPYHDFDVAKLADRTNDYRVRVGNIRAIYTIDARAFGESPYFFCGLFPDC